MAHLNESINTILNQLIDAGSLANMQSGFIDSRLKIEGGSTEMAGGEWRRAKGISGEAIKNGFFPLNYKEPSSVLLQLLELLIAAGKETLFFYRSYAGL
jgi:hypothetical protein